MLRVGCVKKHFEDHYSSWLDLGSPLWSQIQNFQHAVENHGSPNTCRGHRNLDEKLCWLLCVERQGCHNERLPTSGNTVNEQYHVNLLTQLRKVVYRKQGITHTQLHLLQDKVWLVQLVGYNLKIKILLNHHQVPCQLVWAIMITTIAISNSTYQLIWWRPH